MLACIEAGKPVFCEKPLATTRRPAGTSSTPRSRSGSRLVQVGFMRRYDDGLPGGQGRHRLRADRRAAAVLLGPPQPVGARALHQRHGDRRHRGARHRHHPLAVRRGARRDPRARRQAQPPGRRPAGPAARDPRERVRRCWSTSRPRSTSATATTSAARSSARRAPSRWRDRGLVVVRSATGSGSGARRTGGSASSPPTTSSSRSGSTRSPRPGAPSGPAPGTATPPRSCATPA